MSHPTVVITARGDERLRGGHPWIYRSDVAEARAEGGDVVRVLAPRGRPAGFALFSDASEITLRMISTRDEIVDEGFFRRRLETAMAFRTSLDIEATACRLVHGEADLLPSLIVDRYGPYLVVQALSQGVDRLMPLFTRMLVELAAPQGILARNDPRVRLLEGLDRRVDVLFGTVPESILVTDAGIELDVDPWKGQKTGLFLDQRENRMAAAVYASGRLLDCFTYDGAFALQLARRCSSVLAIDISADAIQRVQRNAARNRLDQIETRTANVFDALRELERAGERFDTIVLDPPAFAKNRASVPKALAGYKEINLRALKLLASGGYLVTCSCSYNVSESEFGLVLQEAAADARVQVTVVEKRMQARDHPVLLAVPETYYLKCFILRRVG